MRWGAPRRSRPCDPSRVPYQEGDAGVICRTGVLFSRRRSYVLPPRPMLGRLVPKGAHHPLVSCVRSELQVNRKQHPTYTPESNFFVAPPQTPCSPRIRWHPPRASHPFLRRGAREM